MLLHSTFVDSIDSYFDSSGGRKAHPNSVGGVHAAFNKSTFPEGFIMVTLVRIYTYCSSDKGHQIHLQNGIGLPNIKNYIKYEII
jgi:hypothetical protein